MNGAGKGIVTTLDSLMQWITRVVALNLLWILYAFAGLLVAGIFPATTATLGIARKWVCGEREVKLWKTFKKMYKENFVASNILGWIITLAGAILYFNFVVISSADGEIAIFIPFAFYFILFFYVIIVIWSFPLSAHYNASWIQHFKNALIIGLTKLHYTIAISIVLFSIVYFSLGFPGLIPFFSISIAAICCMWFAWQVFNDFDSKAT